MRDFTLKTLEMVLIEILHAKYRVVPFVEYLKRSDTMGRTVIIRHDVDRKPLQSLMSAEMENKLGIKGTYYFRVVKNEFPVKIIESIAKLGHEIGYHYDDVHFANGNLDIALESFKNNLAMLRKLAPVKTASMHGSPLSRYDNRDLWHSIHYREFGIIGEPYFDVDFNKVMYLTDTGRRWDGENVSVRDKVISTKNTEFCKKKNEALNRLKLHSTKDIIEKIKNDQLPDQIMLTIHPQRWTDEWIPWIGELIFQNAKNVVKYFVTKVIMKGVKGKAMVI